MAPEIVDLKLKACLLGILQRGITEARSLAYGGNAKVCADLLDALDNIPVHLYSWRDDSEDSIRTQLSTFRRMYPDHTTDYVHALSQRVTFL